MNEGNEGLKRCVNPTYMIKWKDLTSPEKAARARRRSSCQTSQAQPSLCNLCFKRKDHKGSIRFEPPPRATFRKVGMQPLGSRRLLCRWHLHVWLAMIYHHLGIAERSPALANTSTIYRSSSVGSIKKTWTIFIVSTFLFVSVQIWVSKSLMPQLGVQEHLRFEVRLSLNFPVAKQKMR